MSELCLDVLVGYTTCGRTGKDYEGRREREVPKGCKDSPFYAMPGDGKAGDLFWYDDRISPYLPRNNDREVC